MSTNTICPKCGMLQKGLNLEETNGLYICSSCQAEIKVDLITLGKEEKKNPEADND